MIIILLKKIKVLKFNIVLNLYYKRIDTSVNNPLAYNIKFEFVYIYILFKQI